MMTVPKDRRLFVAHRELEDRREYLWREVVNTKRRVASYSVGGDVHATGLCSKNLGC